MTAPTLKLSDGQLIPQLGLGTWQVKDKAEFMTAFQAAVEAGYRHFDTAQAYGNEQYLGEAIKASGLKRSDLFITTKINVKNFGNKALSSSFKESLAKLQTDYVDLLLLHFPVPILRRSAWQSLEKIHAAGQTKSIGVSNYTIRHLKELLGYANDRPVVNQVELHVFLQQPKLIDFCKQANIQVEAYSPLARAHIMDNPAVSEIAKKYNKTYAQVMLRFLIELGLVVIPKSVTPERIKQNFDIFDFKLSDSDMLELKKQDQNKRFCWSPVHIP